MKGILQLSCVLFLLSGVAGFADPSAQSTPSATISPDQQQTEIAGARAAVQRMGSIKTFADLGPCLTNRSAGFMALLTGAFSVHFASAFQSVSKYLTNQAGTQPKPSTLPNPDNGVLVKQYDAILAKYGLSESTPDPEPALKLHGREIFADVATLLATLPNDKSKDFMKQNGQTPSDLVYTVVSSTQVDASSVSTPKDNMSLFLEDGLWRMDMGDMGLGSSSGGAQSKSADPTTLQSSSTVIKDPPIFDAVRDDDLPRIRELYRDDHSVANEKDSVGAGPLSLAAFFDYPNVASLLIAEGANVNAQDNLGGTPLMKAANFNHADIVRILLAHGARTGFKDNFGETALSVAKSQHDTEIIRLLTAAGATR